MVREDGGWGGVELSPSGVLSVAHVRRLHSVWTQTVEEGGQPTARIFYAVGQLD